MENIGKKAAAEKAISYVHDGMVLGIGTGSTVEPFIELLNKRVEKEHLQLKAIATSTASAALLHKNIEIAENDLNIIIDLTVDGADKASNDFYLIKGGGGALLREKLTALNSKMNITIVDESKIASPLFGHPLPVEIIPFGYKSTIDRIKSLGFDGNLRQDKKIYQTDNYNYIFDITLSSPISDPKKLHAQLKEIHGVVETGLFLQSSDIIIIGKNTGNVDVWKKGDQ